ncbi:hypothetical protein CWD94_07330 [Lysinibacillus xylanilyticus]|uniref:Uncharacterized protein n=1 Tax=Lysinibacillus xylanilyticus TaxID=582475 RepID=A0A2M9Q8L2_9BACI|nr:hypothetical protein CWD94_19710 [Lysinibacillus xylanilyticus]PJO44372.1 hypothetical protein CWD94_07330 [Lysinibacillus xylanilyticus]
MLAQSRFRDILQRLYANRCFCAKAKRQQQVFVCAKAKRQQQVFVCAKAKRQQQVFVCAKAKRQQQVFACAKAKRQQQVFACAKAKRQQQQQQHYVGHSGVFTGCEGLSLSSSMSVGVWIPAERS